MLLHYHVKNFALIEDASVDFGPGLNVLTGETGAGKSIMIDALNAGLGARTGAEMIRKGCSEAFVELVFALEDRDCEKALAAMDIRCEDHTLFISRRIFPGRSLYKINQEAVTSSLVKQVTELLLDIHGQHEHQSLLKPERQLAILDEFAGEACAQAKARTEKAWQAYRKALKERESFTLSEDERRRRMDFLRFELNEIEQAAVRPGERDELAAHFKEMSAFGKIRDALGKALEYLSEGRENAADLLMKASGELSAAARLAPSLADADQELMTAQDILSSAEHGLKAYLDEADFDEETFRSVEKRLDELHRLELKYGDLSLPSNTAWEERDSEWDYLEDYENRLNKADKAVASAEKELEQAASALHALRAAAVPLWDAALLAELEEMNFLSVRVRTELEELPDSGANGKDRACFTVSLNPGEDLQPLQKVASGGELSRIMLAIKTILADRDRIPTVIFDEIDSGISGQTAQAVARKLKAISRYRQVILITHLPQIAAPADRHYAIEKQAEGERTFTRIRLLDEEDSVRELMRLLGGDLKSESVYRAARELKKASAT
ncbi:MAG: DNA repair protein RecN [Lachnospiraceae bacterium]|nr:DNA repair protein RecN [Lachnospiraceae bacterium]